MKNITDVISAGVTRSHDVDTYAHNRHRQNSSSQQTTTIVNELFRQLRAAFPACMANFKTQADVDEFRRQWLLAFAENGINSLKQIERGMRIARQQQRPFMPSPGQFIAWCNEGAVQDSGLPGIDEIMVEFRRYNRDKGFYDSPEAFPWAHPVMYWIVCDTRRAMYQRCLSDSDVESYAARKLSEWAKKVSKGECIPSPVKALPDAVQEPQKAFNSTGGDHEFRYMPNSAVLGAVTPAQWMLAEYKRRKALGMVN